MSKAVLRFKLPEEQEEFKTAKNGGLYYAVIWDFDNWLRTHIKYGDNLQFTGLQEVRDKLWEMLNDKGVSDDFT